MNGRDDTKDVVVEGRWAVEALLGSERLHAREVFLEAGRHAELRLLCRERGVTCHEVSRSTLAEQSGYPFHRGVYATADRPAACEPDESFLSKTRRLLVLVDLADAGNLGTLLRSAAAFGMDGVVLGAGRGAEVYSRKCIRASATAVFHLPIFEVASLEHSLERIAESGFVVLGTSVGEGSRPLPQVRPARKTALVLGSEGEGLPTSVERHCVELVRIPMAHGLDSLNVAVSGAILMWEWFGRTGA